VPDRIIDLFAGPGGWSEGLRTLGYGETGIEWDEAACATARAAGHERIQADVAALEPLALLHETLDWDELDGLIASPPCQAWSMAGKGGGRRDVPHVLACSHAMHQGYDERAHHAAQCEDPRSMLVVEALRWADRLRPKWIAFEQVPPVLELWRLYGDMLREKGYSVWTGVLEAERFGVPQTRERAVLIAHRERAVVPPEPTHQRYVPGEAQRHEATMFGEVLPWVSMAEALGWDDGRAYRLARGEGMLERHGERRSVPKDEPAPVITSKARTAEWVATGDNSAKHGRRPEDAEPYERSTTAPAPTVTGTTDRWKLRAGTNANDIARPVDEPAPTIRFSARSNDVSWVHDRPAPTVVSTRRSKDGMLVGRQLPEGEGENVGGWGYERPSTTVNGDPRISEPGRHDPDESGSQQKNAVRVTVEEAAILQSFRPDYPWQGSRTKQFEQVGNAVPPMLARAVLSVLIDDLMTAVRATEKAA
jgi:DNA (cytosine-5)-methyltransferase 1